MSKNTECGQEKNLLLKATVSKLKYEAPTVQTLNSFIIRGKQRQGNFETWLGFRGAS